MIEKLKKTEERYLSIEKELGDPAVISDPVKSLQLMKDYKNLTPIVEVYRKLCRVLQTQKDALEILSAKQDPELEELAKEELDLAKREEEELLEEIKILLLPKDPNDDKNVIVEIRAGAGGEEAALFSGVLYRMYVMYAQACGWKTEVIDSNETELGGYKEISFVIEGDGAYSKLKFESGVHRVQRVPETESQGRIQTSTVTVAVLPEAEEVEVQINPQDLEIDTHRASGAGGQHVNKTDSAIRILHKPTGIVVECQDERSQLKNREKAMKVLRSKIHKMELEKQNAEISSARKSQIGTGDRSERIRTYNYPQGRVSDHRIGLTLHSIENILNGRLDELIDALATADRMKQLESGEY
jgi:peptide chain release factor 1